MRLLALLAMVCSVSAGIALAKGPTSVVHFDSAVLPAAAGNGSETWKDGLPIWGHLSVPGANGPLPAIVLMHGCGGIQSSHAQWADLLVEAGYVTLILDSLGPRSLFSTCDGRGNSATPAARSLDAIGALRFLAQQSFVNPTKIAVIGWSAGGVAALGATNRSGVGQKFTDRFAAAIGIYPYCVSDRRFDLPVLVLIGGSDEWTPAAYCEDLAEYGRSVGAPIDLHVYRGVHHGFDEPQLAGGIKFPGVDGKPRLLKYDQTAHKDAIGRVVTFLERHLAL